MSTATPAIRSVKARAVIAPISRPVKNAFGIIEAAPLVLIDVETDQGITGRSYIFAYTKLTLIPLVHLIEEIGRELTGRADRALRPDGSDGCQIPSARLAGPGRDGGVGPRHGVLGCAGTGRGSAIGPVLGGSPRPIRAYDSYGVVDPISRRERPEALAGPGFSRHQDQGRRRRRRQ